MWKFKSQSDAILYVWDYFYCANAPQPGDEVPWGKIERALCRVRESESYLDARHAVDIRLQHARRTLRAVRLTLKTIPELSSPPERWVVVELAKLESSTTKLVEELSMAPPPMLQ